MTEDEISLVASVAAATHGSWDTRQSYGQFMRYGRLFRPGMGTGLGNPATPGNPAARTGLNPGGRITGRDHPTRFDNHGARARMNPSARSTGNPSAPPAGRVDPALSGNPGKAAYQLSVAEGLFYAEGFFCSRGGRPFRTAWCLNDDVAVQPGSARRGAAFFGIAFRPEYIQREYESHYGNDHPQGGFKHAVVGQQRFDPAADLILDIGRDIPAWIREWAVSSQHPLSRSEAPAWVADELRAFGDRRPRNPDAYTKVFTVPAGRTSSGPLAMSYARYRIRRDARNLWLECGGRIGGNETDLDGFTRYLQDGDGLDTLIRLADEHRPACEWASLSGDEREQPELTVQKRAEVHLRYSDRDPLYHSFAVLHRLDNGIWDAWLHPAQIQDRRTVEDAPVLLTRNGVSYERALTAIVQAMGNAMPDEFAVDIPRFA
jgi:hypothetical protein